jgi:TPR repeat protein
VTTLRPDEYVFSDSSDDRCQIGFTTEFRTEIGDYMIEFLQTTNDNLLSAGGETPQEEWVNDISDKLDAIAKTRDEETNAVRFEIDDADHYFYRDENIAAAYPIYKKYAEQGYTDAVYGLAQCYENGYGVEVDLAEAEKLYRDCTEKGLVDAQEKLAFLLARKSEENYHEALKWIFLSEMSGFGSLRDSDYELDAFIEQHQHLIDWLIVDAEQGNEKSQYYLGRVLIEKREKKKGLKLIRKSALKDYSSALYYLIRLQKRDFFRGALSDGDTSEVLNKYKKLVRMGHTNALYDLGKILENTNKEQAVKYFVAAAQRGKRQALSRLVHSYLTDDASNEELVQGMAWLIVCYYIGNSLHSLEGVCEKYEHLLSKELQQKAIKLADEYMEKFIIPNTIKESDWVYGLAA